MVLDNLRSELSNHLYSGIKYLLTPTQYTKAGQDIRFRTMNGPLYSASVEDLVVLSHEANPRDVAAAQQASQAPQVPQITVTTPPPNDGAVSRGVQRDSITSNSTHDISGKAKTGLTVPLNKLMVKVGDKIDAKRGCPKTPVLKGDEGGEVPVLELPGSAVEA